MNDIESSTYRYRRFYIFCVLVFILCFLIFLRTVISQLICLNAGRVLHNKQSVEVETQMTSVERILEYCSLEQEPSNQLSFKYRSPANWPSQGRIVFKNVSMSHSKELNSPLIGSSSYFINN
ncbi:unnamed protein product [Rotaria sp. Silwood2]|nr:unnamed protein product [Rotaria sp. Silwood2]